MVAAQDAADLPVADPHRVTAVQRFQNVAAMQAQPGGPSVGIHFANPNGLFVAVERVIRQAQTAVAIVKMAAMLPIEPISWKVERNDVAGQVGQPHGVVLARVDEQVVMLGLSDLDGRQAAALIRDAGRARRSFVLH